MGNSEKNGKSQQNDCIGGQILSKNVVVAERILNGCELTNEKMVEKLKSQWTWKKYLVVWKLRNRLGLKRIKIDQEVF